MTAVQTEKAPSVGPKGGSRSATHSRRGWYIGGAVVVLVVLGLVIGLVASGSSSSGSKSAVVLSPAPSSAYHNGQTISLAVGPNKIFDKYSRIVVLECADPGGTTANLPVDDSTCDGNTVNDQSILVNADGSFSYNDYQVYALPSQAFDEPLDTLPICDATHACVLYVGQDQNHFTAPKVFSQPFYVTAPPPKKGE